MTAPILPVPELAPEAPPRHLVGISLMLGTMLAFVILDTLMKYLTRDYGTTQVVWARYVFHMVVLVAVLAPTGRLRLGTRRLGLQIFRSLLLLGATACFVFGLNYLPLAEATTITFLSPLVVTALSVPLLRERVGPRRWTAVIVGFVGVLIVTRPGSGAIHPAAFVLLGTALCFGLYQITTRLLGTDEDPFTTLFYTALTGAVCMTLIVPFAWRPPSPEAWAMMIAAGGFGALGHFFLIKAYTLAPASVLAPFVYTQLVWATLAGVVVFGDLPDLWTIVGALVIIGSGLYVFYRESVRGRR